VFDGLMAGIRRDDAHAMRLFIENNFNTKVSEERLRFYERMADTASLRARLRGVEQMRQSDLTSELARIRVPTLILHGVHDRVVPFAAALAQQRLIVVRL
jgi:pimeloyl-ACP methyl ester carboxylesterase